MIAALFLSQLIAADRVALAGRVIRVADVVAGSRSPAVIAALPLAAREVTLSRRVVASLVARHGVAPALGDPGDIRFEPAITARQPAPYEPPRPLIVKDAPIEITTRVGPVHITRSVTAMQSASAGQHLFVRDADGQVFAASVQEATR